MPSKKHRLWAIPLAAISGVLLLAVVVSSFVLVDRYGEAPGGAAPVNGRLQFSAVPRYAPKGRVLFVTVAGGQLNALAAFQGWIDPDVNEQDKKHEFGDRTPEADRQAALAQMRTAVDDAPYVALTKLGYPTEIEPGRAIIDQVQCITASADNRTCIKFVPAGDFLKRGDQIDSVDGQPVATSVDLSRVMKAAAHKPGDTVSVTVSRLDPKTGEPGSDKQTGTVTLIEDPDTKGRAIFGIILADTSSVKLPFDVGIKTGDIGGPSAGLAFTLTVLDELTPGELTGGHKIAATGTIDVNGKVGAIGGIHQKAVSVKQAGAEAFIIPASQSAEEIATVKKIFGADKVFTVNTLDDALAVLAKFGGNALELGTPGKDYKPAAGATASTTPAAADGSAPAQSPPTTPTTPTTT